ncbi:L,D-transpeptidase family protein [Sphingomonas sp.]|uniref:L,D-transpeptidase family protein n=1 Tax=Sphingomonas sp. TaxID=28214 RepID=UPI00286E767F|nr:L,D-transpeptidase family protein [Sphingomonas sp.]
MPATAAPPAEATAVPFVAAASPAASAVTSFYASRRDAPLWTANGAPRPAATALVELLRRASVDGLASGPRLAAQAEAALRAAQTGDPAAVLDAEHTLSAAWVLYVQALKAPVAGVLYGDASASRVPNAAIVLARAAAAPSLEQHVREESSVNPLYSQLREAAIASAQLTGGVIDQKLLANLDRARAIPARGRFILVDAASQRLFMYQDGQAIDSMKVIVGKPEYATPMIASTIHYATFNPYWHVPPNMVRKTIAPNVLKLGAGYLKSRGYEVVSGYTDDARVLGTGEVDWNAVKAGTQEVWVRQLPGAGNSMGKMKFQFPNADGIYLHDTPQRELFAKAQRTLSGGCIRLEDAQRLGHWLLGRAPVAPSAAPEQHVRLPQGVPVYVTYLTLQPVAGQLTQVADVYGRDTAAASARVAALQ